jgi:hypothetical protein
VPAPWKRTCSVWLNVLTGSAANRPAYLMAGFVVLLDVLYPSAMSPARSTARLGMNRWITFAPSGSHVADWTVLGATVPPVTFNW